MLNIKNIKLLLFFYYISVCSLISQSEINTHLFNFGVHRDPVNLIVPNPCDLISPLEIQKVLALVEQNVLTKAANNPGDVKVKSCFYKWDDPSTPHAGMLLQIMTNPVYNDSPEYISSMIQSKLTDGETIPGSKNKLVFKELMIGKVKVIYAKENSKVFWNIGDNYLLTLAFNITNLTESKLVDFANQIVPVVNKNLLAVLLK